MSEQAFSAGSNKKRIAKNTLMLYFRMILVMAVTLYTSRVVLDALGVEDYGIYNVVGGFIALFSILSSSLASAISRFLTFELGRGDKEKLRRIFSTSLLVQFLIGLLILLLAETGGLWFLNARMNIPLPRMEAANWVFQFSLLTFFINLLSVPYNACLIAHEHMSAFAYVGILEAVGKLSIACLISVSPADRLIVYAALMCLLALLLRLIYGRYCARHFAECRFSRVRDLSLLREMFSFAGWNFIGSSSAVLRDQGVNILLNLFFGPAVNAARGIALQVNTALTSFSQNFFMALNPQITKSYASGERDYMMSLIFQGARLAFYLLLFLSLPVLLNVDYILGLWLKQVPAHASPFVLLCLLLALSESVSSPLITAMLATGHIKKYQLIVGGLQMLNLPFSYVLLRMGLVPEAVFVVAIAISQCCLVSRLLLLRGMIGLSARRYLKKVCLNVLVVALLSALVPLALRMHMEETFLNFVVLCLLSLLSTALSAFFVGCSKAERAVVRQRLSKAVSALRARH